MSQEQLNPGMVAAALARLSDRVALYRQHTDGSACHSPCPGRWQCVETSEPVVFPLPDPPTVQVKVRHICLWCYAPVVRSFAEVIGDQEPDGADASIIARAV